MIKRILILLTLCVTLIAADAIACSCNPDDVERQDEKAQIIFIGRPTKIEVLPDDRSIWQRLVDFFAELVGRSPPPESEIRIRRHLNSVRLTFAVSNYVKGKGGNEISVMSGYGGADCGLSVSPLETYKIYVHRIDGKLRTSYCFGSEEYPKPRKMQMCTGE